MTTVGFSLLWRTLAANARSWSAQRRLNVRLQVPQRTAPHKNDGTKNTGRWCELGLSDPKQANHLQPRPVKSPAIAPLPWLLVGALDWHWTDQQNGSVLVGVKKMRDAVEWVTYASRSWAGLGRMYLLID